jgi:hypothetical protein
VTLAILTFLALIAGHCLADYGFQPDVMRRAKNRFAPIEGVPWFWAMGAHAIIHGAFVAAITGILWLGILEAILHAAIDDEKCQGRITFSHDQWLHLLCKVVWTLAAVLVAHS